jgi:hypothetical protein
MLASSRATSGCGGRTFLQARRAGTGSRAAACHPPSGSAKQDLAHRPHLRHLPHPRSHLNGSSRHRLACSHQCSQWTSLRTRSGAQVLMARHRGQSRSLVGGTTVTRRSNPGALCRVVERVDREADNVTCACNDAQFVCLCVWLVGWLLHACLFYSCGPLYVSCVECLFVCLF